jgi:peroxiredoxin family protein
MKKTVLTHHAHEKIEERLLMSAETVCELLDADVVVNTGGEKKSNRYHKVFYSPLNKMCFVAIQDCKTGHIVTVLPIDYHQNTAWVISYDAQLMAKEMMQDYIQKKEAQEAQRLAKQLQKIRQIRGRLPFRVYGYLEDDVRNIVDRTFICSWKDETLSADLGNLIEDDRFITHLFERLNKKRTILNVNSNISIKRLSMQLGRKGEKTLFHIEALKWFNKNRQKSEV